MNKAFAQSQGNSSLFLHEKVATFLRPINGPILDVGCGKGNFLKILHSRGKTNLTGCDACEYKPHQESGFNFIFSNLNSDLPFADNSFSAVTAIEVIEHLENPRHLIREIHRVLQPGGLTIITTPNNESITSLISLCLRGHHSAFAESCYPAHITPVLQVDLKRMLLENSFNKITFHWSNQGRIPGTRWHWQKIRFQTLLGKRFSDNLIVNAVK